MQQKKKTTCLDHQNKFYACVIIILTALGLDNMCFCQAIYKRDSKPISVHIFFGLAIY